MASREEETSEREEEDGTERELGPRAERGSASKLDDDDCAMFCAKKTTIDE